MAYLTKKMYSDKLKDPRWQKVKTRVLERDEYTCQFCRCTDKQLQVHHFYYNQNGNPWDVSDDGLTAICEDCHFIEHFDGFTKLEKELIDFYRMLEVRVPGINQSVNNMILSIHENPYSTNGKAKKKHS